MTRKPVVLCILDGWGIDPRETGNAPYLAQTPCFDALMTECPNATLLTHGAYAGLPDGQVGNSEVGHTNIGAGRVVQMDLVKIDAAIASGQFAKEPALEDFIRQVTDADGTAHVMGLVSDGGVHSMLSHMNAMLSALTKAGLRVDVHALTDGRDVSPTSSPDFLDDLQRSLPVGARIASVIGRYFAMDRDNRWERVERAYHAIVEGKADHHFSEGQAAEVARAAHADGKTDEFIEPAILAGYPGLRPEDGLICLNFRADRAREILAAIGDPTFAAFDVTGRPKLTALLGMVDYSEAHTAYMSAIYPKERIQNTLGAWVAHHGLKQFRLAETEKYPHVTFFLNGGVEVPEVGEDRYMAPSPKVATYDLQPEMSAPEVTAKLVEAIKADYDLIVVNYANPDMVGHTGDLQAAIKACAAVDAGLQAARDAVKAVGGAMIVTADHGNCDVMIDPESGGPHTAHTLNPVPVILVGGPESAALRDGVLADLAPTLLGLMGLDQPAEMTGKSLIAMP